MKHRAPLTIAIALLLLPVLYVGSYLALVQPNLPKIWVSRSGVLQSSLNNYRWGGNYAEIVFWPLEQIDRKVRPHFWQIRPAKSRPWKGPTPQPRVAAQRRTLGTMRLTNSTL